MEKLPVNDNLTPFVKEIFFLEDDELSTEKTFPFYADGFAGIIYSKSIHPFYLQPRNKELPNFYLFGQTITPISLDVKGRFKLIAIRLYPFAVKMLLGIDPKILNDDCFDLLRLEEINTQKTLHALNEVDDYAAIIKILTNYINELLKHAASNPNYRIKLATSLILKANGNISIKEVRDRLYLTERTLERHFLNEIGISAKQFSKIIQFSASMKQITDNDYINLTEISYDNGFADQSHFIRTFKQFSGKTPKEFQKEIFA